MKFPPLNAMSLPEAVGWTARSLPLRPHLPVLNGLLITASAGEVSIASFDHETSALGLQPMLK